MVPAGADSPDALIIGAGVVGCSIARALASAGYRTLVVDRRPAPGYGSTSHSSAIIRPFYSHVVSCAVAHASRSRWVRWRQFLDAGPEAVLAQYREAGGLILFMAGQEASLTDNLLAMDEVGVDYEILDIAALQRLLPGLSLQRYGPACRLEDPRLGKPGEGTLGGAIHIGAAGHVNDPQLAAHNLYTAATVNGATFLFDTRVAAVHQRAGRVVGIELEDGSCIDAPVVINAAGPHSAVINGMAGIVDRMTITTRPQRHEVAYVRKPQGLRGFELGFLADVDSGFYARSDGTDLVIGSTDPECDPPRIVDPEDDDQSLTDQWTLQVMRAAQRFPDLPVENAARGTVGLYDVSDDWVPIYDKSPLAGFYLAIGTSGNQFKNAPLIGDIMLAIVAQEQAGGDHDHDPATLLLPELNRTIDLSFYSRLRKVHATRSVLA